MTHYSLLLTSPLVAGVIRTHNRGALTEDIRRQSSNMRIDFNGESTKEMAKEFIDDYLKDSNCLFQAYRKHPGAVEDTELRLMAAWTRCYDDIKSKKGGGLVSAKDMLANFSELVNRMEQGNSEKEIFTHYLSFLTVHFEAILTHEQKGIDFDFFAILKGNFENRHAHLSLDFMDNFLITKWCNLWQKCDLTDKLKTNREYLAALSIQGVFATSAIVKDAMIPDVHMSSNAATYYANFTPDRDGKRMNIVAMVNFYGINIILSSGENGVRFLNKSNHIIDTPIATAEEFFKKNQETLKPIISFQSEMESTDPLYNATIGCTFTINDSPALELALPDPDMSKLIPVKKGGIGHLFRCCFPFKEKRDEDLADDVSSRAITKSSKATK